MIQFQMRLFSAIILLLVLLCPFQARSEEPVPLSEEQKLKVVQKQLQESRQKLRETKEQQQEVLGRLVVITKELRRTTHNLQRAQSKIKTNEAQIGVLAEELSQTETELRKKQRELKQRMLEVYKGSGLNYLELMLTSNSMSDFINRIYFFGKIIDYDARLVQDVRADASTVRQKKNILQAKTKEIRSLAQVIAEKKEEIAEKAVEKKKVYQGLTERKKEFEAQVEELEKSSYELELLIQKRMAERKGTKLMGSGRMAWPVRGELTSYFGYRRHPYWGGRRIHTGLDIATKWGTPVGAADSGEVIFSGWWDGYGKAVVVDHGRGITTVYAHLSRIYKQVGDVVAKGQTIGLLGSTGYSTGPHLHFEVRIKGKPVNPLTYLK